MPDNSTKESFTISELAAELDISPSAIRFYEDKGLLSPSRTTGNQRLYTRHDRGRLKLILRGKRFGASLAEIAEMVGPSDNELDETQQIEKSIYYINKRYHELQEQKKEILIYEKDLTALKKKLSGRMRELSGKNRAGDS
jgi:DNA-binding transcriptional MerR regulator